MEKQYNIQSSSMKKSRLIVKSVIWIIFISYLTVLFLLLFWRPEHSEFYTANGANWELNANFEWFKTINMYVQYQDKFSFKTIFINLAGNVIAFVPFGFLYPIARQKGFFRSLFVSLLFPILIECTQLYTNVGRFDVDDILLNTIGGWIGVIVYFYLRYHHHKKKKTS